MGKIIRNGIEYSSTVDTANNISYDNSLSGLEATTTQKAIDEVADRLNDIGTMKQSAPYSGEIEADSFCPNFLELPKGKWIVTTSGYVALSGQYQPFGLGDNVGYVVKGFNPSLLLDLNNAKRLYIWSLHGATIQALDLVINAIKVG